MGFKFGQKSIDEQRGVHPNLISVANGTIAISPVDFSFHDGLRALETQQEYVRTGVSKTLDSKHIKQKDGFGHAMDLVPYIGGKLRWEWPPIFVIARCVQSEAIRLGVPMTWGAVWDCDLRELSTKLEWEVEQYKIRHPGPDFLDGPHFQLR